MRAYIIAGLVAAGLTLPSVSTVAPAGGAAAATAERIEELPEPTGRVLLTVTGAIEVTNSGDAAVFDLAMLDALAARETTAQTPWYDEPRTFSGPLVTALLDAVGARGKNIRVMAINNYAAEIPLEDIESHPVILASRIDGGVLSVREKGPLFVIYPFDQAPELYNEIYFGRSVWQVTSIEVY